MTSDGHIRGYGATLLVGLLSGLAVAVGVAQPWVAATASVPGIPTIHGSVDGASVAPLAGALGYVLLAAFGAVIATRGWLRRAVGSLIVVAAVAVAISVLVLPGGADAQLRDALAANGWPGRGPIDPETPVWRWLVLAGSIGAASAGAVIAVRGHRFAVMGARYDAVSAPAGKADIGSGESDLWRAIDRGDDPTT